MTIDPKLIRVSACGKYVYPVDSITGAKTFAMIGYFESMLAKKYGGDVAKFVKEYVTRETKKYLEAGYSKEEIKELASQHNGKLPKLNPKLSPHPNMPKKERKPRLSQHASGAETIINSEGVQEVIKTYPWSADPANYFRSAVSPFNIEEVTKSTCLRPNIYLDSRCQGCPYFSTCQCQLKILPKSR